MEQCDPQTSLLRDNLTPSKEVICIEEALGSHEKDKCLGVDGSHMKKFKI